MLEFGMPTLIENKTIEDNIALCKELGLSFIELNMNFPEYQIDKIEDIDCFYKKADEALYCSKEKGKSTYTFYS